MTAKFNLSQHGLATKFGIIIKHLNGIFLNCEEFMNYCYERAPAVDKNPSKLPYYPQNLWLTALCEAESHYNFRLENQKVEKVFLKNTILQYTYSGIFRFVCDSKLKMLQPIEAIVLDVKIVKIAYPNEDCIYELPDNLHFWKRCFYNTLIKNHRGKIKKWIEELKIEEVGEILQDDVKIYADPYRINDWQY
jgi:hypothetical protein